MVRRAVHRLVLGILALYVFPVAALPLTDYAAKPGDTLELYLAGSSAQDNGLQSLLRLICATDSLDVYRVGNGDVRLLFCRTKVGTTALSGFPQGQKIAIHKTSVGGSGGGVGPLIQRSPMDFLNVEDLRSHLAERCPHALHSFHSPEGTLIGYEDHECTNPSPTHQIPEGGISDVDPQYLLSAYRLAPNATDLLSVHHANAFIFGIPVSLNLRNALQTARFAPDNGCNPNNSLYFDSVPNGHGTMIPRGESEPCMPSLSRVQLAGMFSGRLARWHQILTPTGYPLATRDPQSGLTRSPAGIRAPADDRVYICRRGDTSGTQAAYEMFFLHQRCTAGVTPFVAAGEAVQVGSVSSDVPKCLASHDERNNWAIGILSTETVETLKSDHWRFIKMDGVAPTLFNTYNGRWPFFVEQSYQWRNEGSGQELKGPKLALMARVGLALGDPAIVRNLNRAFWHPWGSAGIVALSDPGSDAPPLRPTPGTPLNADALDETPILAVRHDANNCGAVIAEYPTVIP
jgi:hypothetical protein